MLLAVDELMDDLVDNHTSFGFENSSSACLLDLKADSSTFYLHHNKLTQNCIETRTCDKYVFWDVTHPTTSVHELIAKEALDRFRLIQN